jgi:putative oxidoreductase
VIPKTAWAGATLALGVISGTIVSHLTQLGIEVQGDGGYLFFLAMVVFVTSADVLWMERKNIPVIGFRF